MAEKPKKDETEPRSDGELTESELDSVSGAMLGGIGKKVLDESIGAKQKLREDFGRNTLSDDS